METVKVVNIKCGGCEEGVIDSLTKAGLKNVSVDVQNQLVSFDGDRNQAVNILTNKGYPEAGTKEAASLMKKAKSYVSCMIGKTKKMSHNHKQ